MKKGSIYQLLTLGAVILAGCSQPATNDAKPGDTASTDKPVTVAFVTNNASDFWTIAKKGTEKAASELSGVTVEFKMPAEGTAAEQKQILDDLVAKGTQGIAISPVDPANSTEMLNEVAKKALVITQDSDAPESDRACYIGTDNVAAGRQAGEEIKKALPNGGKIMVFVGKIDAQNAKERYEGIKEALKGSKVEIVDVRTDNADHLRAKSNVADTLVKYSDLAWFVGLWSYNGPATLNAVKDGGKVGKIKIVCFDEEDETPAGIKDGSIDATVVQQPFEFGYQSVKTLVAAIRGDKSVIPESKLAIVPTLVVNKENVEEFTVKLNGLRGRS